VITPRRPNLLVILTNQQRHDTVPGRGQAAMSTPALRALAEESFAFTRAWCAQPLCSPARASLLTGRWPHEHGTRFNNQPLAATERTLAEYLPAEYRRAWMGKWHLGDELRAQHGFDTWCSIEDGLYRPFYTHAEDLSRRSDYHQFLLAEGFPPDATDPRDGARLYSREFAAALGEPFAKATFLAARAADFLRQQPPDVPFCLVVSFLEMHPPHFSPLNRLHAPAAIPTGPAFMRPPAPNAAPAVRRLASQYRQSGYYGLPFETETHARRLRANYLGMVSLVDRAVGRVLAALREAGHAEDTLVVFTADHGEQLGDHALVQKGVLFEPSTRVPLLVRAPWLARGGRAVDGPFRQVDLMPTLLDLLGLAVPDRVSGCSRADWFTCPAAASDVPVVIENFDPRHPTEEARSLIDGGRWKLNVYRDGHRELFDLAGDPAELENLVHEPAQRERRRRMVEQLRVWQSETGDAFPPPP
jgi:arylsulfatase A-like enzyme